MLDDKARFCDLWGAQAARVQAMALAIANFLLEFEQEHEQDYEQRMLAHLS